MQDVFPINFRHGTVCSGWCGPLWRGYGHLANGLRESASIIANHRFGIFAAGLTPGDVVEGGPAEARLDIRLIGPMRSFDAGGAPVLPRHRKTRALLAVLAIEAPAPVARERLASLLWSDRGRPQAFGSLRQSVRELQECLRSGAEDMLRASRDTLTLATDGLRVDLREVLAGTAAPDVRDLAIAALAGPLLDDLAGIDRAFDAWRAALRAHVLPAAITLARAALARVPVAETTERAGAAERLANLDPLDEDAAQALMESAGRRGDPTGAAAGFARLARALAASGRAPSDRTLAVRDRAVRPAPPTIPGIDPARASRSGLRLGVRAFRTLSAPDGNGLAQGLAEEITTALARFRWLFLLSAASLDPLADEQLESPRWRDLGLDFVLDGSIQREDGPPDVARVRVNVRLLDMRHGVAEVAWAQRFERPARDLFALQDEIAAETVAQADPALLLREGRRVIARSAQDATAYELMLRAIPDMATMRQDGFVRAGIALKEAVARDPEFGAAHAWYAYWHIFLVGQGWADDPMAAMQAADRLANRGVALDPSDGRALTIAGHVRAFLHSRLDEALDLHGQALRRNPNLPLAWAFSGLAHAYAGRHPEAIAHVEEARRLSPADPLTFFFDMSLMMPRLMRREFVEARTLGRRSAIMSPTFSSTLKGLLCVLGHLGDAVEAGEIRDRLLALEPEFTVSSALARSPLSRREDRDVYADGLRLAGLPD